MSVARMRENSAVNKGGDSREGESFFVGFKNHLALGKRMDSQTASLCPVFCFVLFFSPEVKLS